MSRSPALRRCALVVTGFLVAVLFPVVSAAVVANPAAHAALPPDSMFQKVRLHTETGNPMAMDVAPDGRVFYIDRLGDIKIVQPNGATNTAAHLDVFTANESGGLNIALDPGFATNQWAYVVYSPNSASVDRLSRFNVNGNTIDLSSEKIVLDVPVQRQECCHHGAGLVFDKKNGNLWLSTGDNTNPFASDGYTPIDERSGRAYWDAQRTSGNTNSLSGKVLRIHPEVNGTYTIPAGNLFPPGTANTRPEIYMMGERNPFRMNIDPKTGFPTVANYGPDAPNASSSRGPQNTVEWDVLSQPGNAGWPYCIGPNLPYNDYNFASNTSGGQFDCTGGPTNNSPNNTGQTKLPPAIPAMVYYHYQADPAHFPMLSGGAPTAGPVYRYDPNLNSSRKWPVDFDGRAVFAEWNTSQLFTFQLDAAGTAVTSIDRLFPSMSFNRPMDFDFGPDGALYVIEWGSGYGGGNSDAGIDRIDYLGNNQANPTAKAGADRTSGPAPLTVNFSSAGSADPGGSSLTYSWNFGDGTTSTAANPSHTYTAAGNYTAVLTVRNSAGATGTASVSITSGNTTPALSITAPPHGGVFGWGDVVNFSVTVTDPEDGTVDCTKVTIQAYLGHDTHGHPLDQYQGCSAQVQTTLASGHTENDNTFYVIEASYTDKGGAGGANPLTGRAQVLLQPKHKQAEFYSATGRASDGTGTGSPGVTVESTTDPKGGGSNIGSVEDGDWWSFDPVNMTNVTGMGFRVASGSTGGTIQVRTGSPTGTLLGSVTVPGTGGWQTWTDVTLNLANPPTTSGPLYFVARKPAGSTNNSGLFNVNWVMFDGAGIGTPGQSPVQIGVNYHLVAAHSGKLADINGGSASPGGQLIQWSANSGLNQQFDFLDSGGGYYRIRARHSGLVLQVAGSGSGADITQQPDSNAPSQQWRVVDQGGGAVSFVNRQSALAMDVWGASTADGARISQYTVTGNANQRFQLRRA
ncbi:RICIN domain-containing protein [Goodfellowiella coeruleoviolacea]|uniref:PKD domain-containing protein n=1 Tax=Goodfellowiella coeruleoviolacea TaxID=334858 RepID=A0AAE3GNC3_9PSEU|nr:RICIN domain-containing protein [Goodfellowiella coeruleoviolacea]MCP2170424.1 PKD domain-containing protein [Goodfellowiella coeruleoviolacea]